MLRLWVQCMPQATGLGQHPLSFSHQISLWIQCSACHVAGISSEECCLACMVNQIQYSELPLTTKTIIFVGSLLFMLMVLQKTCTYSGYGSQWRTLRTSLTSAPCTSTVFFSLLEPGLGLVGYRVPLTTKTTISAGSSCEALYRNDREPPRKMALVVDGRFCSWPLLTHKLWQGKGKGEEGPKLRVIPGVRVVTVDDYQGEESLGLCPSTQRAQSPESPKFFNQGIYRK